VFVVGHGADRVDVARNLSGDALAVATAPALQVDKNGDASLPGGASTWPCTPTVLQWMTLFT
jgi:hypothetical protein